MVLRHLVYLSLLVLSGCFFEPDRVITKGLESYGKRVSVNSVELTEVMIRDDRLYLSGSGLSAVNALSLDGKSYGIETSSDNSLTSFALTHVSLLVGKSFDLILSDARGQSASFRIELALSDGVIEARHLSSMGASSGQVLLFNGSSWIPEDLDGLTFSGEWNAATNTPNLLSAGTGDYYIVTTSGMQDLGSGMESWSLGDWAVYTGASWVRIASASGVRSFNGRTGDVTPQAGDYSWSMLSFVGSSVGDLADVNTTGAGSGDVLKWNGASWAPALDNTLGTIGSSEITDGSISDVDVSDIDMSKVTGLSSALSGKLDTSGGTLTGTLSVPNIITSGLVDGVDVSNLDTQATSLSLSLAGKEDSLGSATSSDYLRGDKVWSALTPSAAGLGSVDNVQQLPMSALDNGALSTSATTVPTSGAVRSYADSLAGVKADGSIAMTGALALQAGARFFDSDQSNYVELGSPSVVASNLTLTLPATGGSSAQVLTTDGSGTLSWTTPASLGSGDITEVIAGNGLTGGGVSGSVTLNVDTGTGADQIVQLDGAARLPALDGSQLTDLPILTQTLTGYSVGSNTALLASDTLLSAFGKLEAQAQAKQDALPSGTSSQFIDGTLSLQNLTPAAVGLSNVTNDAQLPLSARDNNTPITTSPNTVPTSNAVRTYIADELAGVGDITSVTTVGSGFVSPGTTMSGDVTLTLNTGTNTGQLLLLDTNGQLPVLDGSNLTELPILTQALSGLGTGTDTAITASDTVQSAFENLQAQIDANNTTLISTLTTGDIDTSTSLGTSDTVIPSQNAVRAYVNNNNGTLSVETHSSDYTVNATTDHNKLLLVTGSTTITLPPTATAGSGFSVTVKKMDATNVVMVDADGTETIDGNELSELANRYSAAKYVSSGSEWVVAFYMGEVGMPFCPDGYVRVPGNSSLGTGDFCVMQFEARNISGVPESRVGDASTMPWSAISANNAQSECESISNPAYSGSFSLISNPEWMTIARNAENVSSNWSGGSVGSGVVNKGHTDGTPSSFIAISDTSDVYIDTGNSAGDAIGSGWEQKRIHTLSNGSVIWDFAGNHHEWVDWNSTIAGFTLGPLDVSGGFWRAVSSIAGSVTYDDLGPNNASFGTGQYLGAWWGGAGGAAKRGGGTGQNNYSGLYNLDLSMNATTSFSHASFRCVYRP